MEYYYIFNIKGTNRCNSLVPDIFGKQIFTEFYDQQVIWY